MDIAREVISSLKSDLARVMAQNPESPLSLPSYFKKVEEGLKLAENLLASSNSDQSEAVTKDAAAVLASIHYWCIVVHYRDEDALFREEFRQEHVHDIAHARYILIGRKLLEIAEVSALEGRLDEAQKALDAYREERRKIGLDVLAKAS